MPGPLDRALWLTVRGASPRVVVGWLVWTGGATLVSPTLAAAVGPVGAALLVLGVGWWLARRMPVPLEWLRRYHLDDTEVTAIGPGGRVRRLPWSAIDRLTTTSRTLTVEGDGLRLDVPVAPLLGTGGWGAVVARVVPDLADEMWALIEDGEELHLVPAFEPPTRTLAWWAYVPALLVAAGIGAAGPLAAAGAAVLERTLASLRARALAVTVHRAGVRFHRGLRPLAVAWPRAEVMHGDHGLFVGLRGGSCGRVAALLPNYCAAAAVIELKAQLGPGPGPLVSFRARLAEGRLAIVGEVEPSA